MSNLDKKLRGIIVKQIADGISEYRPEGKPIEEIADKILKSVADEGYIKIPQVELSTPNHNGYEPKAEIFTINGKEVMTGQEWYERFNKELAVQAPWADPKAVGTVLKVAKRASGIKDGS